MRIFAACAAVVLLFLAGCGKKTLSKSELRTVTGEIVAAAQKINGHKSEIAIRPELHPTKHGSSSSLSADSIYISVSDASQTAAFAQALQAIARKHDLSITDPPALEQQLNQLAGVVTVGLFATRPADVLLIATNSGVEVV